MVVIRQSVLDSIYTHGQTARRSEVCGVLVGEFVQEDEPMTLIEAVIEGQNTTSTNGSVTFTADTWQHIQQTMDEQYPSRQIVGWYHTHPDHGVFLSEMDTFIHDQFFMQPWQVAFVYDPVRQEQGMFARENNKLQLTRLIVEDDLALFRKHQHEKKVGRLRKLHKRLKMSLAALIVLLVSALVLLLATPNKFGG